MIILSNITLSFGERMLFDHISLTLQNNNKVGLVGNNGAGKSTLLKAIAGLCSVDGTITISKDTRIAYMPQEVVLSSEETVFDETFSVFHAFLTLEKKLQEIEQLLEQSAVDEQILERYCVIQEQLQSFDKARAIARTVALLSDLGFTEPMLKQITNTLSVGWKMRVVLAQLLLQNADFYLFDEPTNHLDLSTKEWFLEFLKQSSFGYLLISHDRRFLQQGCTKIYELEHGKGTLYHGNYDSYVHQKTERTSVLENAYERQQREIEQRTKLIDRFKGKASKARMAQSMIKKLEKIEKIELPPEPPHINITFPPMQQPGKIVLTLQDISHSFNEKLLFSDASCEIKRGSKVALIAPNGCGKTTLFNIITRKINKQSGTISLGHNVKTAFFEQDQTKVLNPTNTIMRELQEHCPDIPDATIRALLGAFLFQGNDVFKPSSVLSGGEKNRVAMVKTLLQGANFLILDEPTNHLDIPSQDVLLDALKRYPGTILIVSHDHTFVQSLADTIMELKPHNLITFEGSYDEYRAHKKMLEAKTPPQEAQPIQKNSQQHMSIDKSLSNYDSLKKIRKLESMILKKEQELSKINAGFMNLTYGTSDYMQAIQKQKEIKKEIDNLTTEWETLTNMQ